MSNHKSLYIDTEALSTLALVKAGLISPVDKLMNKEEAHEVDTTQVYKGVPFPFSAVHNFLVLRRPGNERLIVDYTRYSIKSTCTPCASSLSARA